MSIERGNFFEGDLAKETKLVSKAMTEVLALDPPPAAELAKNQALADKMLDLLEKGGKMSAQEKASVEYMPWAMFGRMVVHASDCLSEGRENSRSVRMYRWVAEKLGLEEDPRKIAYMIDEKADELLDKLKTNTDVNLFKLIEEVRIINEAVFPSGW